MAHLEKGFKKSLSPRHNAASILSAMTKDNCMTLKFTERLTSWFGEPPIKLCRNLISTIVCLLLSSMSMMTFADEPETLNFNRDIRPILSAKCFACHGPDAQNRDSEFRLDTKEGAFADLGGYFGIAPGQLNQSELYRRIVSTDESEQMPPPAHKKPMKTAEIELLKRWIKEGAPYSGHWAFEPMTRPPVPAVQIKSTNQIDHFIAARLTSEGFSWAPAASPATLFRRLYLDLTGLPPSLRELEAFLEDPSDEAYEHTIRQLMKTPAFAERMAMEWLDVARYADTNGYSIDDHRDMWGWRDWVIRAFQINMPYDQFIREQLAGDLIKNASENQIVGTGFLRNSMNTHEGGTIPEEYKVARIADQIDTVSTAFLGLTIKCAQCHDHKFDPISQRDYYRFYAFFNTSSEPGHGATNGNTKPLLSVSPILQNANEFKTSIKERIAALEFIKANPEDLLGDARLKWEQETLAKAPPTNATGPPNKNLINSFPFPKKNQTQGLSWIGASPAGDGEFAWFRKTFALKSIPERAQLYISCDNEAEIWVNGKLLGKNPDWRTPSIFDLTPLLLDGENLISIAAKDWESGGVSPALLALVALPDGQYILSDSSWRVSTKPQPDWNQLGQQKRGSFMVASVIAKHGDGPWGNTFSRLKSANEATQTASLFAALRKPSHQRINSEQDVVTAAFAKSNPEMGKLAKAIDGEIAVLEKSLTSGKTTVMVMDQAAANRKTPILIRGQYDQHGEIVSSGIPEMFGETLLGPSPNRLDLANWLTDRANPLTARVTVNRYWQMLFATGLVKTTEDFGSQGEWPSHPELLDWLAAEFIASGWDVQHLLTTMLLSRTYRQSSNVNADLLERDPYNRLLARAPRYRLSAESVRDGALAIGGLLTPKLGGPSVFPPQPNGLWKEVSHFGYPGFFSAQHFFPDRSHQVYRRSIYTFWKRTSPPPVLNAFDAPTRETCAVRRSRTNTPLQALVLMNEPQFVEASRGLARWMSTVSENVDVQIRMGFRRATARYPSARESEILRAAFARQIVYFSQSSDRVTAYLAGKGTVQDAALTTVASLILNLDETITRE